MQSVHPPQQPPPSACPLCRAPCRTWEDSLFHNWQAHQRLEVSAPFLLIERQQLVFPCLVCGVGSGVVFGARSHLCQHLLEHLFCEDLTVPADSALALQEAALASGAAPLPTAPPLATTNVQAAAGLVPGSSSAPLLSATAITAHSMPETIPAAHQGAALMASGATALPSGFPAMGSSYAYAGLPPMQYSVASAAFPPAPAPPPAQLSGGFLS